MQGHKDGGVGRTAKVLHLITVRMGVSNCSNIADILFIYIDSQFDEVAEG